MNLQDFFQLDTPFIFLISVLLSILATVFTTFYFDHQSRKRNQRQKEVNLKPIEEDHVVTSSESEESDGESVDEKDDDSDSSTGRRRMNNAVDTGAGDGDDDMGGLLGKLKTARLKQIEETLTEEQLISEKEIEREQLQAIFELLRKQEKDLDMSHMDESDLKAQLNMYR